MQRNYKISLFLGNIIDHFDKSLYGLLVPFLAPLFFPDDSLVTACAALFFPIGFLARPLGALCIGWIGDRFSQEKALWISLQGVCLTTTLMGFLPTSAQIGPFSYIILMLLRALLSFFSAGEAIGAFLVLIKDPAAKKKSLMASLFEVSGILGTFCALISIACLARYDGVESLWRHLFILSGFFSLGSLWLRRNYIKVKETPKIGFVPHLLFLWDKRKVIAALTLLGGFSYVNYEVALALMNIYFSLEGTYTYESMLWMSALLLVVDMLLLPLFGLLAEKAGQFRLMVGSLICYLLLMPLAFLFLQTSSLFVVLGVRMALVTVGVAFCASLKIQFLEMTEGESPYTLLAFSKALAAQCLGHPTLFISLQFLHLKNLPSVFLFYPSVLAIGSLWSLLKISQKKTVQKMD